MPVAWNTPEIRFDCPEERKFGAIAEVKAHLAAEGAEVDDIDGVRVNTTDGWWLARASNTQAVLVVRAEASSPEGLERLEDHGAAAARPGRDRSAGRVLSGGRKPAVKRRLPPRSRCAAPQAGLRPRLRRAGALRKT